MSLPVWKRVKEYQEIHYDKAEGIAKITINRPHRRNAFTPLTNDEISDALHDARFDAAIGVVILTGAGTKAFASSGSMCWTCTAKSAPVRNRSSPWLPATPSAAAISWPWCAT